MSQNVNEFAARVGQMEKTQMTEAEFHAALFAAVVEAIETVGMEAFKATSFFGSNDRVAISIAA